MDAGQEVEGDPSELSEPLAMLTMLSRDAHDVRLTVS